ncbi:bidirectional sugar transporter SWEET4-like isoform X1 [Vigna umbellata]|uniref:bidirectional sugar transporter SWEET4-like isoform X1 n=1 Tax=Vigna umbellata TaxID=87088 RepID=UPI001F5F5A2C|nr:bidirectional sugar transporter SWEET4-like isoform X1 [Vigna umbellata]
MTTADIARTVVGIIGNVISGALFLSPVPTFIEIWKKRSVEQFSAIPYLAMVVNCMVWTLYGLPMVHPHSILVVTINGSGSVLALIFIALFLIYSDGKKRLKVILCLLLELLFIAALTFVTLTQVHTFKKRSEIVGTVCILFNIMMYASPLSVMKLVIKTKSVEYMPFFISLASFGNGVAWTTYALIRFDPFITIPNGLGTLLAVAQLVLYATYYKSTQRQIAARNATKEVNLSHVVVGNATQPSSKPNH